MNRTKKFMLNTIASALYQVIVMLVGIITPRIMLVVYGSEVNGLVSSITQFVSYFTIVEAGLSSAAVYSLYKPIADNDTGAISRIVTATRNFYYKSGAVFSGLLGLLAALYPVFVKTQVLSPGLVAILVLVLGANSVIDFFLLAKYRAILSADQRSYVISIGSMISTLINFAIVVILSNKSVNIVFLKTVAITAVIFRSLYLFYYCRKHYGYLNFKVKPDNAALSKRWSAFYLQLLQVVQRGAPTVLITFFSTLQNVSIYSIFNMVITGVSSLLDIFMSGLSASFGDIIVQNDLPKLQKTYRDFEFTYYGLITIVYGVTLVLIMPFIRIYTKGIVDANYNQPMIGILFVVYAYLYNVKTPQGMLTISAGLFKETRMQCTIQALLVIIIGVVLAPTFGLAGVLVALIVSNTYRDIDLMCFIPKHVTKLPIRETAFRILRSIITLLLIILPARFVFIKQMTGYVEWVLHGVGIVIYATLVWLVISYLFEREQLISVKNRMFAMLHIKQKRFVA
ncbi:MAG: hypothetical protein E7256_13485 [Lachnospiraceae bacterium]|nr:hypothetical protein [Lachnospiraceae bacterium]